MADYTLAPYRFTAHREGDANVQLRMNDIGAGSSAAAAIAGCLAGLASEGAARDRADNTDKSLTVTSCRRLDHHVTALCELGSKGLRSVITLKATGTRETRSPGDVEDFKLRAVFMADPSARAGLFLCERQGQYSAAGHLMGLLKRGIQNRIPNTIVNFEPVHQAGALQALLDQQDVLEAGFKGFVQSSEPGAPPAAIGLRAAIRLSARGKQRGRLGRLGSLLGRDPREVASVFGINVAALDQLSATAQIAKPDGSGVLTIALEDGRFGSLTYPVERVGSSRPTRAAIYQTANTIVNDVADVLELGHLTPLDRQNDKTSPITESELWEVPADEVHADRSDISSLEDLG